MKDDLVAYLQVVQLSIIAWSLFVILAAFALRSFYPVARARIGTMAPTQRASLLRLLCLSPVAMATALTALCFVPSFLGRHWARFDHCALHDDGHAHFCLFHLPTGVPSIVMWCLFALVLAALFVATGKRFAQLRRSRLAIHQLVSTATRDRSLGVLVVESDEPLALTTGMFKANMLLSTGLLRSLSSDLVRVIVEHERAHARRADALWRVVSTVAAAVIPPVTRRALLADLELASEQACDEEAGATVGSRVRVAQALVATGRLLGCAERYRPAAIGFGGGTVVPRAHSLLADRIPHSRTFVVTRWIILAALTLTAMAVAEPFHHAIETLFAL